MARAASLLYCCFTAALLLLYCCFTAALLLLYCCFTAGDTIGPNGGGGNGTRCLARRAQRRRFYGRNGR
jgi:hypothetical protein